MVGLRRQRVPDEPSRYRLELFKFKTSMEIQRRGPAAPPLNSSSGSSRLLLPGIDHYFRHLVLLVSPYLVHLRSLIE
jgi:hypothetical protein